MRRGASLSSPSETAAKWRSIHLGLFFLLSQISRATKHPPLHGLKDADDMKRIAFMVLIFYLAQNYRKKSIRVKKKVIFFDTNPRILRKICIFAAYLSFIRK